MLQDSPHPLISSPFLKEDDYESGMCPKDESPADLFFPQGDRN